MDSITQAALGAAIGQAGFRELGRRALLFGAICGTLPDLDSIVFGGADPWARLVAHRGLSHSIVVLPFVAIPLGWVAWRVFGRKGTWLQWVHLAFWGLVTHPLLDTCTTYGTQLLAPFTDQRFSWDTIAIIDAFYTIPLLIALGLGVRKSAPLPRAKAWARGALTWGCIYLVAGWGASQIAKARFVSHLEATGHTVVRARTTVPALFPVLRHGVARLSTGAIATNTFTPWGPVEPVILTPFEPNPRMEAALNSPKGEILRWFADDYLTTSEDASGGIRWVDHRYGQYTDSSSSFFQSYLPAGVPPGEILLRTPRRGRERMDMGAEFRAGWQRAIGAEPSIPSSKGEGDE